MMTAPSWSGEPTKKMVVRISAVTSPLTRTPLTATFSRPVSRSKTIRAPVRPSLRVAAARITASTVRATGWVCRPRMKPTVPSRPTWSRARRNSGWKRTITPIRIAVPALAKMNWRSRSWKAWASSPITSSTASPTSSCTACVPRISLKSW